MDKINWSALGVLILIVGSLVGWGMTWRGVTANQNIERIERIAGDDGINEWIRRHEDAANSRLAEIFSAITRATTLQEQLEKAGAEREKRIDRLDFEAAALKARQEQSDTTLNEINRQLTDQSIKLGVILDRLGGDGGGKPKATNRFGGVE